jgi:hypothetical protein
VADLFLLKQRKALGWGVFACAFLWGFYSTITQHLSERRGDLLISLMLAITVTLYCIIEAQAYGRKIPVLARWLMLASWPVAAPLCLIWLRGKSQIGRVLLICLAVFAVSYSGSIVASILRP